MDDKIKMYFLYNLIKYFKNENKRQSWWIIQNVKQKAVVVDNSEC